MSPPQGTWMFCTPPWLPTWTLRQPQRTAKEPGDSPTMCLSTQTRCPPRAGPTVTVPLVEEGVGVGAVEGAGADDTDGRGAADVVVAGGGTVGVEVAGVGGSCGVVTAVTGGATGAAGGEYTVPRVRDQTTTDAPAKAATQKSTMRMM